MNHTILFVFLSLMTVKLGACPMGDDALSYPTPAVSQPKVERSGCLALDESYLNYCAQQHQKKVAAQKTTNQPASSSNEQKGQKQSQG